MATNTLSSPIVLELLRDDNYANWSSWMKNYLLAQDLWDIVTEPPSSQNEVLTIMYQRKKNAAALHAILISCGVDIVSQIREISSAKIVWDKLETMYEAGNPLNSLGNSRADILCENREIKAARNVWDKLATMHEPGNSSNIPGSSAGAGSINNDLLQYEALCTAIKNGDWVAASNFLGSHPGALSAIISVNGRTVLHLAVSAGHERIVELLVELMSAEELEIRDENGVTALAQAAILPKTRMVKCMFSKNTNLLNIPDNQNRIPLIRALEFENIEVARLLVSLPVPILSDIHASTALTLFIYLNNFDVALHLLHRFPRAAIVPNLYKTSPLAALASMSSAFPSGNKLVFWKNWIYAYMPIRSAHSFNDIEQLSDQLGSIGSADTFNRFNVLKQQSDQLGSIGSGMPIRSAHSFNDAEHLSYQLGSIGSAHSFNDIEQLSDQLGSIGSGMPIPSAHSFNVLKQRSNQLSSIGSAHSFNDIEQLSDQLGSSGSGMSIRSALSFNVVKQRSDQLGNIGSVLGLLGPLPSNLLKLLGMKQIYEMKLLHQQANLLLLRMCKNVKEMNVDSVNEAIFHAINGGVIEFIIEIVKEDPKLWYTTDEKGRTIFSYAVLHRQAKIFNLIYSLDDKNSITNAIDTSRSTILHMAAMLEPSTTRDCIAGEALKMQSELQWFKEIERICPSLNGEIRNNTKMTARELFTHNHMDMVKEGEKWMKGTASSCTVVAALIMTIMFTAAFTVPGGNNQNTGFPIFSHKELFMIFIICDALSLFSSSISVLVFLGILTSRYAEKDFLLSLPIKMIIGLFTLFFSIATMMSAFCAGLFLMLPEKSWMIAPVIFLASVTVCLFASMQFSILFDMVKSTFVPSIGK